MVRKRVRVAIVGTFDVANYGDLLFPLLAQHELSTRLGDLELVRYSYREMDEQEWPYSVRSVTRLPDEVGELDLLIVGGGHLVRFDKDVAPGYQPADVRTHHPTGYWLAPTLLAALHGVPIAWNAVGVSASSPEWSRDLLRLALRAVAYVSARDTPSAEELGSVAEEVAVRLVPDSAFGVRRLLPESSSDGFRDFCADSQLEPPYAILQPSRKLLPHVEKIKSALAEARAQGLAVLELPVSAGLGDKVGLLRHDHPTVRPARWPDPLLLAEIVSQAEAVMAQSLHLSITALACGVPVHRLPARDGSKYGLLAAFDGVHVWEEGLDVAEELRAGIGRREPGPQVAEQIAQLKAHWDSIAALTGCRLDGNHIAAELITRSTSALEEHATAAEERLAAAETRFAEREKEQLARIRAVEQSLERESARAVVAEARATKLHEVNEELQRELGKVRAELSTVRTDRDRWQEDATRGGPLRRALRRLRARVLGVLARVRGRPQRDARSDVSARE